MTDGEWWMLRRAIFPMGSLLLKTRRVTPGLNILLHHLYASWTHGIFSAENSPCCGPHGICLSNGLCFSETKMNIMRGVRYSPLSPPGGGTVCRESFRDC